MDTAAGVLDALESVLALERELGARTVEMDRSLLRDGPPPELHPAASVKPAAAPARPIAPAGGTATAIASYAFIFDRMPEGAVEEMVVKMMAAMKCPAGAIIRVEAAAAAKKRPNARIYVVMGSDARKIFMPSKPAARGLWTDVDGVPTLVTYSPARLLRFYANDPEQLKKSKLEMWHDLQSAMARLKVSAQK